MKKIIAIVMVLTLAVSLLTACSVPEATAEVPASEAPKQEATEAPEAATNSSEPAKDKAASDIKKIGVSLYYQKDEWYVGVNDEFQKQGKERGYEMFMTDADANPQKQVEQVENLVSQNVDLMMIAPVDDNGVVTLIDTVNAAGIPVMAFNTQPAGGDYITFVGWDVYQTGLDLGNVAVEHIKNNLGGKANVVILGIPEMENLRQRADGFKDALDNSGLEITYVAEEGYEGLRDKAMAAMETIIQKGDKIDIVFAAQDPGAFGARSALEAAGIDAKVYSCGGYGEEIYDAFAQNDKYIAADIIVSPYLLVKGVFDALDKYVAGEPLEQVSNIPIEVCTSKNYKQIWGE